MQPFSPWMKIHIQHPVQIIACTRKKKERARGYAWWMSIEDKSQAQERLVITVIRKVRKTQHEAQFATKLDGFLSFLPPWMLMYFFAGFFWISPCVWPDSGFWSFFLSASTAATYIFTAPNCTSTIISLEPCTLNAEYQSFILSCGISYWDLLQCLCFAYTTEWGVGGERRVKDRVTLHITLRSHVQISHFLGEIWQLRRDTKREKF